MVKVFSFILSAYLIFLNAVPCCAIDNCADELTMTQQQASDHEAEDENDCSNCSPFFTCTNCAGFSTSVSGIDFSPVLFFSTNVFSGYTLSLIPGVHHDFWQPPRLS
jgi:hypothetical protein